jgi:hypothetical protein
MISKEIYIYIYILLVSVLDQFCYKKIATVKLLVFHFAILGCNLQVKDANHVGKVMDLSLH